MRTNKTFVAISYQLMGKMGKLEITSPIKNFAFLIQKSGLTVANGSKIINCLRDNSDIILSNNKDLIIKLLTTKLTSTGYNYFDEKSAVIITDIIMKNLVILSAIISTAGWTKKDIITSVYNPKFVAMIKPKKAIRCLSTGIEYASITAASKALDISKSAISAAANKKRLFVMGMAFDFVK